MKTKRAHCSSCSNGSNHPIWDGKEVFNIESCEWLPVWECRCCHTTTARRVYRTARAAAKIAKYDSLIAEIQAKLGE